MVQIVSCAYLLLNILLNKISILKKQITQECYFPHVWASKFLIKFTNQFKLVRMKNKNNISVIIMQKVIYKNIKNTFICLKFSIISNS